MKTNNLISLGLVLILFLFACKKSKNDPQEEGGDKDGAVEEVYPGTMFNDAAEFITSFSGNYMVIKSNSANNLYQYSSDGGATWKNLDKNITPTNVNDEGYFTYIPAVGNPQFSRLGKPDAGFSYNITGGEFVLGKDNYIYDVQQTYNANKVMLINSNNGESTVVNNAADTLGKYCGQDQHGGIAFINHNGLSIHQPESNSWVFHPFNIVRLYFTSSNVSKPSKFFFNGFDKLVVADQVGFHVYQTGTKDAIQNFNWPSLYNYYDNPYKIAVNKSGNVFATISKYGGKPIAFKITNGNMMSYPNATYTECKGAYTYEMYPLEAKKISAGKTENISSLLKEPRRFKNAYITENNVYAIYQIEPSYNYYNGEVAGADTVIRYTRQAKNTKPLNVSGTFNFVYQDGNQVFVSGNNELMYSANNGDTWEKVASPITNNLLEVKKIGNTYYGMCKTISTYTSTYGTSYSHTFKMLTSTNLKNWVLLPGASHDGGETGPETFTRDGFLSYFSGRAGGLNFYKYSIDFGKTWESTNDFVVDAVAELNDGRLVKSNHNGGSQLYLLYYKRDGISGELKGKTTYNAPQGRDFTHSYPRVPVVSENGSFYYFNGNKIFKLK